MNPAVLPSRPFNPPPRLVDPSLPPPSYVPATLTRGFPIDLPRLASLEAEWGAAREEVAKALEKEGDALENRHWRWTWKAERPADWHCLVTVECRGQVQGIMAVETLLRPAVLSPPGWVVYVDYVEIAPWNIRVPRQPERKATQVPRYLGVGTLLIAEAVRMGMGLAASGRVGLHALPQAEAFYVNKCKMQKLGPDPAYYNLVYFEYPDGVAPGWMTGVGLSA